MWKLRFRAVKCITQHQVEYMVRLSQVVSDFNSCVLSMTRYTSAEL